jgi:hypothetical protein
MIFKKILFTALAVFSIASAAEAATTLPLKQGIFVDKKVACSDVDNSSALAFWGDQLNDAHIIGHIVQVKRQGKAYVVTLELEGDSGMGGNARGRVNWIVLDHGAKEFALETPYGPGVYRWCFSKMPS